jgi:hypothetical protein
MHSNAITESSCFQRPIDGGLLQDAAQMKLDVLSAVRLIADYWRLITPTTVKKCFVKCGFSIERVSTNDDSVVKLTEDEEDDWHSIDLGVQSEDYPNQTKKRKLQNK